MNTFERLILAYGSALLVALGTGLTQAFWLAAHHQRFGPFDTLGGTVAALMVIGALPLTGLAGLWLAARGGK